MYFGHPGIIYLKCKWEQKFVEKKGGSKDAGRTLISF